MSEADDLDKLLEQIADGGSVDWDALERAAPNEETRQRLRQLRLIAEVAEVHRSDIDDVTLAEDDVVTVPVTTTLRGWPATAGQAGGGGGALPPGEDTQWGHLLLVRKIGEGAFGEVFQAHDTWLDHPVALKLLKRDAETRVSPSLILHEARKLARVRHTNVVTVHGADRHNGRVGFWMDFIDGETLATRVAKGRLSAGEATYVGQEVCKALSAVHQAKLIHRDVKAHNVMRASDGGRIILMDFGAGELVNDPSLGGRQHGTPLYLAPELLRGGDASAQSDIYAVGVLLYHLVSGRYPVEAGSPAALLDAHAQGPRRRLRDERADLPRSFIDIVEQAVHPDPAQRFASAGEMEDKLSGEPSAPLTRPSRGTVANRLTIGQYVARIAAGLAALVAGIGILGFVASRAFDVILHIEPDFRSGFANIFSVGLQALFPFVLFWLLGAAVLAALRLLLFWRAVGARWARIVVLTETWDPATVATVLFVLGAASWIVLNVVFYRSIYSALADVLTDPGTTSDLSILGPARHDAHRMFGYWSSYLSMLFGLIAWRWFPSLERRARDVSTVRVWKWATLAVAFAFVLWAALPRRVIWERFPVVAFDQRMGLVIGSTEEEQLVIMSNEPGRPRIKFQNGAPELKATGTSHNLFESRAGQ